MAKLPPGSFGVPVVGQTVAFLKNGFEFIDRNVAKHGPIFRAQILGKFTAVISGAEACEIWTDPELITREKAQPGVIFKIFAGPSLPHLDAKAHRERKELMLTAFEREAMNTYLPGLEQAIDHAFQKWAGKGEFAWIPELKRLAIEGICGNFLGLAPDDPMLAEFAKDYDLVTKGIGGFPVPVPGNALHRSLKARDRILERFKSAIKERRKKPTDDGLSRILAARISGKKGITDDAAMREMHHVIIAGYIIFAEFARIVIELSRRVDIRHALKREVATFDGAITLKKLEGMSYLTRFTWEIKRHVPVLPAIFGRAKKRFIFKDREIKKGWMVLWALRATMMDPAIYRRPEKFDPDRFAPGREEHKKHPHAFVPHGPGPMGTTHQCPGTDYATIFMKLFTLRLLKAGSTWNLSQQNLDYNWSLTPPEPRDGLKVKFGK